MQAIPSPESNRIPKQRGEVVDRSVTATFSFDGQEYTAYSGDTIASALTAADVKVLSRSFKYHRPRGLLCCAGHCPNCLVQVGDEPNVRACRREVTPGMNIRSQNAWPSLNHDFLSLTQAGSRLMPVGFYYKTFIRPPLLWPFYERVLRQVAGLGKVDPDTLSDGFDKQYLHTDVAVVGGGLSGISAALSAAKQGARVMIFDSESTLGGHLRYNPNSYLPDLLESLGQYENVTVFTDTTILGWYKDNWLSATQGTRLFKVRSKSLIVATGAYEVPIVFGNNDLPGVMLGSAVQRLLHLFGVCPGKKILVVTANEDGWRVAADLRIAGLEVVAIVDKRSQEDCIGLYLNELDNIPIFYKHTILDATGTKSVKGAKIGQVDPDGRIDLSTKRWLECDLIAISVGWVPTLELFYMAGGKTEYNKARSEILPVTSPSHLYVAGRAAGTHALNQQIIQGKQIGLQAFNSIGSEKDGLLCKIPTVSDETIRTSMHLSIPSKKKQFVCFCEDVTDQDIEVAVSEGYQSIELLKRYSTVSMGPCQGKMCSMNAIHLCALANNWTVQETGKTTARPPTEPVALGTLAGQKMEPAQLSPIHSWHVNRGAQMMLAGLWLRPEHYSNPRDEVLAVRERVGLIDVSTLGKLQLTGSGVPDLLERIYVNQWRKLRLGKVRYGVMCNDEGIILDDGVCARLSDELWYMSTTSSGVTGIFEWIQWWLQSGWGCGIHLTDLTEVFSAFNITGPKSREVLRKLTSCNLDSEEFPYMSVRNAEVMGVPCRLMRIGFTGELSYEIHCPSGYAMCVWESLMQAGEEFDILPFGVEAQRILRLEKAHIIVGQDTDALSDPFSANMDWIVKMNKPDFLGKRAFTRITAEGTKQLLVGFNMDCPDIVPEEGSQIVSKKPGKQMEIIGWVTSSRFSPTLTQAIGLCWLPKDLGAQNGAPFTIYLNGKLEKAYVHHGAFYDSAGARQHV